MWLRSQIKVQAPGLPRRPLVTISKTVDIRVTDKDGLKHEYHSLDEVPPEMRAEFEKLESMVSGNTGAFKSVTGTSEEGKATKSRFIFKKDTCVYMVKDASGNEQTYHSLEELPPEIRAAFEKAQNKTE